MTPAERAEMARIRVLIPKRRSGNRKVGSIYATITDRSSCPPQCVFRGAGCYAEGYPLRMHWDRAADGVPWETFLAWVRALPAGIWRHNQAGDLPNVEGRLIRSAVLDLADANAGRPCIVYTHCPVVGPLARHNRRVIRDAARRGLHINVSVDHPAILARIPADIPAAVVIPHDGGRSEPDLAVVPKVIPGKRAVVRCPATYRDTSCQACGLCARPRTAAVGFPVHGNAVRKAQTASESAVSRAD